MTFRVIFFFGIFKIEVQLIYNSVLISAVKWFSYTCLYVLFYIPFCYSLSHDIEYNFLCCTVGPCCLSKYTCLHLLNPRIIFLSSVYNIADEIVSYVVVLMTAWSEMHLQKLYFKNKTQYQCGKTMKTIRVNCVFLNHELLLLYKSISLPAFSSFSPWKVRIFFKSLDEVRTSCFTRNGGSLMYWVYF